MRIVTADEMRALDRTAIEEYGISGLVLMENAGTRVVDQIPVPAGGDQGPVYRHFYW
ncbi:MAG: hypothetical protein RQM92_13140 [Candidatus Syntrophopropionicum ammoniitolerans]